MTNRRDDDALTVTDQDKLFNFYKIHITMSTTLSIQSDDKMWSFVSGNLSSLLTDDALSDVTFEITSINEHDDEPESHFYCGIRSLFAIHCPVFRKMLYGSMMEADSTNTVRLPDISCETFEFLQRCFYGLDAPLTASNVVPIGRVTRCLWRENGSFGIGPEFVG